MAVVLAVGSRFEILDIDDTGYLLDARPGIGHIVGDIRDLSMFDEDMFDRIELIHVIEHLWPNEVLPALDQLKRVLKNDGVLEIRLPDMLKCAQVLLSGENRILYNMFGTFEDPEFTSHKFGYTPDTFREILNSAGFSRVVDAPWAGVDPNEMRFFCIK